MNYGNERNLIKIMKLSKDYQEYKNGEIIRYNGKHKIKQESIAEHSFIVAINIIKVCKELGTIHPNVRNKAVTMAILHDISERYVGDIAFEFKHQKDNKPVLEELFDKYEQTLYLDKYEDEFGSIYKELIEENNGVADRLVKLGDSMSVLQYSERELSLGNGTRDMVRINRQAAIRVEYDYDRLAKAMSEKEVSE